MTMQLHHADILKYLSFVLIISGVYGCQPDETPVKEDVRTALLAQVNNLRTTGCTCGNDIIAPVKPLQWNTALEDAARNHAKDMSSNNFFSHLSLDGRSPINRAIEMGYDGEYVGEVIARRYHLTKEVIEAWNASESHCRALMDSLYNEMGGAKQGDYWVVDLGKSK